MSEIDPAAGADNVSSPAPSILLDSRPSVTRCRNLAHYRLVDDGDGVKNGVTAKDRSDFFLTTGESITPNARAQHCLFSIFWRIRVLNWCRGGMVASRAIRPAAFK